MWEKNRVSSAVDVVTLGVHTTLIRSTTKKRSSTVTQVVHSSVPLHEAFRLSHEVGYNIYYFCSTVYLTQLLINIL